MPKRRLLQSYDLCFAGTVLQVKNLDQLRQRVVQFEEYQEPYVTLGRSWVGDSQWKDDVTFYPIIGRDGERQSMGLTRLRQFFCLPDSPQPAQKLYVARFRARKTGLAYLDRRLALNRPDEVQLGLPAEWPLEQVLVRFQAIRPEWFSKREFLGIEDWGDETGAGAVTYLATYFQ